MPVLYDVFVVCVISVVWCVYVGDVHVLCVYGRGRERIQTRG